MSDDKGFESEEEFVEMAPPKEEKKKKSGSAMKAILVSSILTIALELWMGLGLDVVNSLTDRYIAYMLGIFTIFVMSVLSRSIIKMIFFVMPVVLLLQFGLAFLLPDVFSALMAPFLTIIPVALKVVESASTLGLDASGFESYITLVKTYGIVLDFVIALFVGFFASIGLVNLTKLFTQKPGIFTIFQMIFGIVFFLIGVILFPYIIVVITGVSQFSMAFGIGGLALNEGFNQSTQGNLTQANVLFAEAVEWFDQADLMLSGINDMGVFYFVNLAIPDIQALIENGFLLIQAGLDLAKGVGPVLSGVAKIQTGIGDAMSVMGTLGAQTAAVSVQMQGLSAEDQAVFDKGIATMEEGFVNLTQAIPSIKEAVNTMLLLDDDALIAAAEANGLQGTINKENLDLIRGAGELFLVVLNVFKVLITDADESDDVITSPFVHLLKGALALNDASSLVGDSTSFEGTEDVFRNAVGNFSVVVKALKDPIFTEFAEANVGNNTQIVEIKNQMDGIFKFLKDAGEIAIAVGNFGIQASPVISRMNSTLSVLTSDKYDNFTQIPDSEYNNMIGNLTDLYPDAQFMSVLGAEVDFKVGIMDNRTADTYYGFMNSQAADFVSTFKEFDLTENAANFFYLIGGFIGLIKTIKILRAVDSQFKIVQDDLDSLDSLDTNNFDLSQVEIIQTTLVNVNGNLSIIDDLLGSSLRPIDNAVGNFTNIGPSMPQMAGTATALSNIKSHIVDIQCTAGTPDKGLCRLLVLTTEDAFLSDPPTSIDNTNAELQDVQMPYITDKFGAIQTELGNIAISG